jgi:DNA-directed RNA polymerase subunit RPC12/RpoP
MSRACEDSDGDQNMYRCLNCGKDVDVNIEKAKKIICPYCGYKIIQKKRPNVAKRVIAR